MSLFSIRLQELMERKGKNQAEVADKIGVSRSSYAGYEKMNIVPPYKTIRKLAEYFDVSIDYLMGQTNFEKYEFNDGGVPNIVEQLNIIMDALKNESVRVKAYNKDLTPEEKKMLVPYVEGVINAVKMIDSMKGRK